MLTELLPPTVIEFLKALPEAANEIPTIALSLDAPTGSLQNRFCAIFRSYVGRLRGQLSRWRTARGFLSDNGSGRRVTSLRSPPQGSLLRGQFSREFHHEDTFCLTVEAGEVTTHSATAVLAKLLEGFLENRSPSVSRLMAFRNVLVKPLGLRTSPLACPVSSLLSTHSPMLFVERFPVIEQAIAPNDERAQVILGADDKHLRFRSCVGVETLDDGRTMFTLGTRVQYRNLFGRFYMAAIDAVHRSYVSPTMLRLAADYTIRELSKR